MTKRCTDCHQVITYQGNDPVHGILVPANSDTAQWVYCCRTTCYETLIMRGWTIPDNIQLGNLLHPNLLHPDTGRLTHG